MSAFRDLTGMRFGRLLVIERHYPKVKDKNAMFLCKCDCGNTKPVYGMCLTQGRTTSCGCYNKERSIKANTKHGHNSSGRPTSEYRIWSGMIKRCMNENCPAYHNYGGRGIKVCDEWKSNFLAFYHDMGPRPSAKHSIDRINNNGNYEPGNCRWATDEEQAHNKRLLKSNKSGYSGVSWSGKKNSWCSYISINNRRRHLGTFKKIEDAIKARIEAEIKYWDAQTSVPSY